MIGPSDAQGRPVAGGAGRGRAASPPGTARPPGSGGRAQHARRRAARSWPPAIGLVAALVAGSAAAQAQVAAAPAGGELRPSDAMLMLDYQVIDVPGDAPIDLLGFHVLGKVRDGIYLGAGVYAPHVEGEYGGFMAFDVGAHLRYRLAGPWLATADLSAGGGGGGRSVEQSKVLSGTGGFVKASVGLAYDLGAVALGVGATRMKFRQSRIDSTQANVVVTIPYTYLSGSFARHGETLSAVDDRRAAREMGRSMLTVSLDNLRQIDPQGSFKGTLRTADLQYSHFFAPDRYWFAALGVGYRGRPIYNQMLGGVGQRLRLTSNLTLAGQIGVGSGGYAPEVIDTGPGLLVYPKVQLEYALTRDLGLAVSAGHLSAPKATSRNHTYAVALVQHLRAGAGGSAGSAEAPATWRGFRGSLFQQTEFDLRYQGIERGNLRMIGVQIDTPLGGRWYLPLQAAVATNEYLGYPGYGELLAGLGVQTRAGPGDRLQGFGQLMAGANVHGLGLKAGGGLRVLLDERLSLHVAVGRIETRGSGGRKFSAASLGFGLDYRFAVPVR